MACLLVCLASLAVTGDAKPPIAPYNIRSIFVNVNQMGCGYYNALIYSQTCLEALFTKYNKNRFFHPAPAHLLYLGHLFYD